MNVSLRPLMESDAYTSWKWRNDPEVFKATGTKYSGPITLQNEIDWIRTVLARPDERRFAILADGIYVGNIYLTSIGNKEATISIFIGDKSFWNKGVGTKAYSSLIHYALHDLHLSTIKSIVRKENITSLKLHKSAGFSETSSDNEFLYLTLNLK